MSCESGTPTQVKSPFRANVQSITAFGMSSSRLIKEGAPRDRVVKVQESLIKRAYSATITFVNFLSFRSARGSTLLSVMTRSHVCIGHK